jgi:hypothetical protein
LIVKLGRDVFCPHGNRVNKSAAGRYKLGLQQSWEAAPASLVRNDSVHKRDRRLLEYFDGLGIRPGTSRARGRTAQSQVAVP